MEREQTRYDFLVARDGEQAAKAFMLDLARTYRKVILGRKTHRLYRLALIESYLSAKRLAR